MKKLIIFFFFSLSYIPTEAQNKNFSARRSDSDAVNKTKLASIHEKNTVDIEAIAILHTERNNTSDEEKQTIITENKNPTENNIIRSSLLVDAVRVNNFSNDEKVRTPIYSEDEKERQIPRTQHMSVTAIAVSINQ